MGGPKIKGPQIFMTETTHHMRKCVCVTTSKRNIKLHVVHITVKINIILKDNLTEKNHIHKKKKKVVSVQELSPGEHHMRGGVGMRRVLERSVRESETRQGQCPYYQHSF